MTARWLAAAAHVVSRHALVHPEGADPALDRSGHVRAASGLAWLGTSPPRLVVAQDDTSFLALLDEEARVVGALTLPHSASGRRIFESRLGNKKDKLDLESCARLPDGRVVVVGSGSLPARERVVVVDGHDASVVSLPALYAALRALTAFAGAELNVEGAAVLGDRLVLANRGNGASTDARPAVDALLELPLAAFVAHLRGGPLPAFGTVRPFDLGAIDGVRLTFTDLCAPRAEGPLYFLASAEASPNAVDDGVVVGTAIGRIDGGMATLVPLLHADGARLTDKIEGLTWARPDGTGDRVWVVVDRDDPDLPSECLTITLPPALL
jgi:hypothetical protein